MHTKAFPFLSHETGSLILTVGVNRDLLWEMLLGIRLFDRHGLPNYAISACCFVVLTYTYECCQAGTKSGTESRLSNSGLLVSNWQASQQPLYDITGYQS